MSAAAAGNPLFRTPRPVIETRPDGTILVRQDHPLLPAERSIAHLFAARAAAVPKRVLAAERDGEGWRTASYGAMLANALRIATDLTQRGLAPGDRLMILSGEGVDHLALTLGAMLARVIVVPVSVGYALAPDLRRLEHALRLIRPRLVYARDSRRFDPALAAARQAGAETRDGAVFAGQGDVDCAELAALLAAISPETPFKILLTSGSTASPKGVIQTHGMSCASLAFEASLAAADEGLRPPTVVLDLLPWSHVGGSITIFHNVLRAGASLYFDDGKPVLGRFEATLRNLAAFPQEDIASTPAGYAMLVSAMDRDFGFRAAFFSRLRTVKTGAAPLPDDVARRFQQHAVAATGRRFPFLVGYGSTETHGVISVTWPDERPQLIGLPKPGVITRLVPAGEGFELRIKSPSQTPGYFDDLAGTAAAIDDEGFLRTGDAVRLDNNGPWPAIVFEGRLTDNFKMASGTWVAADALRATVRARLGNLVGDCLVVGEGRGALGLLIWTGDAPADLAGIASALHAWNAGAGGASERIERALVSRLPISVERFERTEQGTINRQLVIRNRQAEIDALHADPEVAVPGRILMDQDKAAAVPAPPPQPIGEIT